MRQKRAPSPFGARLEDAIKRRYGGTGKQSTFADAMRVSRSRVTAWTYDELPSSEHLMTMADVLHVSLDWLLLGKDDGSLRLHLTEEEIRTACQRVIKDYPKSVVDVMTKAMLYVLNAL